jgi:hypothetical protein
MYDTSVKSKEKFPNVNLRWLSRYSVGLRAERLGFNSRQRQEIFLFYTTSRLVLGPTRLISNGYRELFPQGESGRDMKLTTQVHLVPRSRIVELYLHSLIRLHGVVLNKLSTRTTLPFVLQMKTSIKLSINLRRQVY